MKLLTKELIRKLEKRGHGNTFTDDDPIIAKFFNPMGSGTWYIMEGEKQSNGDWYFYGFVDWLEKEWGYFSYNELATVKLPFGLGIERDMYFSGHYSDIRLGGKWN